MGFRWAMIIDVVVYGCSIYGFYVVQSLAIWNFGWMGLTSIAYMLIPIYLHLLVIGWAIYVVTEHWSHKDDGHTVFTNIKERLNHQPL